MVIRPTHNDEGMVDTQTFWCINRWIKFGVRKCIGKVYGNRVLIKTEDYPWECRVPPRECFATEEEAVTEVVRKQKAEIRALNTRLKNAKSWKFTVDEKAPHHG